MKDTIQRSLQIEKKKLEKSLYSTALVSLLDSAAVIVPIPFASV